MFIMMIIDLFRVSFCVISHLSWVSSSSSVIGVVDPEDAQAVVGLVKNFWEMDMDLRLVENTLNFRPWKKPNVKSEISKLPTLAHDFCFCEDIHAKQR